MKKKIEEYSQKYPERFFLVDTIPETESYLKEKGFIDNGQELVNLEKPGEGNMNCVLRAEFNDGSSFVIKQSRPWVEKYPEIKAYGERLKVEAKFYEILSENDLDRYSPEIKYFDEKSFILIMEDLGETSDLTYIYQKAKSMDTGKAATCIQYLNDLKKIEDVSAIPRNIKMRKLNYEHIFVLPFQEDNGFNLDDVQDGLSKLADPIISNKHLKVKVSKLGEKYLGEGEVLVHGDFYPGSILDTKSGLKVIDPEFGFVGPSEWDLSIFCAHLLMAETPEHDIREILESYEQSESFNKSLFAGFVGTEIIRRIIGLAQLPLELTLNQKEQLLEQAVKWILEEDIDLI